MASRRRYFLLDEPCAAVEVPKMMCRVVVDKYLPLYDRYVPVEPVATAIDAVPQASHNTNDIIPGILPEASSTTNRKDFLATVTEHNLGVALTTLFGLNLQWSQEERAKLETAEVKRYALKNPGEYFKTLMRDERYASEIQTLLKDSTFGRAYLVTGFMTSVGSMWTRSGEKRRVVGGQLTAPIAEALGAPSILPGISLDPSVALEYAVAMKRSTTMLAADEEIFAVAYAVVKRRYSVRAGFHKVEKVGPPLRGKAHHLVFSGNEGNEDEDEEEDENNAAQEAVPGVKGKLDGNMDDIYLDEHLEAVEATGAERSILDDES